MYPNNIDHVLLVQRIWAIYEMELLQKASETLATLTTTLRKDLEQHFRDEIGALQMQNAMLTARVNELEKEHARGRSDRSEA